MALITCKDCKKEFSTDAKQCPNCGAKNPKLGTVQILAIGFLILVAISAAVNIISPKSPKTAADEIVDEINDARFTCEEFVKRSLHDPDSAEFDNYHAWAVSKNNAGAYTVLVTLRARNGFNAMRKLAVSCRVIKNRNANWNLLKLDEIH